MRFQVREAEKRCMCMCGRTDPSRSSRQPTNRSGDYDLYCIFSFRVYTHTQQRVRSIQEKEKRTWKSNVENATIRDVQVCRVQWATNEIACPCMQTETSVHARCWKCSRIHIIIDSVVVVWRRQRLLHSINSISLSRHFCFCSSRFAQCESLTS